MTPRPPRLARALLERVLPAGEAGESMKGDALEEFARRAREGSAAGARWWYRRHALGLAVTYAIPTAFGRGRSGESLLRGLGTDLRLGFRSLKRSPTLALTAILVLALGIGANAVVFSVVNELLLRPLPVEDQETLVDVWPDVQGGNSFLGFGWEDVRAYRAGAAPLESLAAFTGTRVTVGEGQGARPAIAQLVSPEYMPMMGLEPSLGTLELPAGGGFGSEPVAVLGHGFWRDRFGSDPGVVGRTLRLDGRAVTVVGVGPAGFSGHFIGFPVDLWLPITAAVPFLPGFDPGDRASMPFEMIGRLRPGATVAAASDALRGVARELERQYPETHRGRSVGATPTTGVDHSLRGPITAFVAILTAVSALVLVIACLNVGSVLLVRTMARGREMAVRLALGAGNGRLVRQLAAESMVLAVLGAGAGVSLALLLNSWLRGLLRALTAGLGLELAIDARVLSLTVLAAGAAAAVAAVAPVLHILRKAPASALTSRGPDVRAGRVRGALVVAQVAVSVVLITCTGLFVRALTRGLDADPGFDPARVAVFVLDPGGMDSGSAEEVLSAVLRDVEALPGVEAVSVADAAPIGLARSPVRIQVAGVQPPAGEDTWTVDARRVGAGWLGTVGIDVRSGRDIEAADRRAGAPVAVVSESFAERFWPGEDVVGRSFVLDDATVRVVGVAAPAQYLVQDDDPDPIVYLSAEEGSLAAPRVVVRGASPTDLSASIRRIVEARRPGHVPPVLRTAEDVLDTALLPQRLGASVVGAMGLAALFLAAVGLYGLVQFTVTRNTPQLAVRLALGGSRRTLVAVVLRKGFLLAALGVGIGVAIAAAGAGALSGFLRGVSPRDPATYGAVVGVFAVVAFLASWLPALRAARIPPARALRGE